MTIALPKHFLPKAIRKPHWSFRRWAALGATAWQFGRRHRPALMLATLSALLVIVIRISIPFLFKELLKPMLSGSHNHRNLSTWLESSTIEPTLIFGVGFLILLTLLGFFDFFMRLKYAQFAIGTVRDLRARAFRSALLVDPSIRVTDSGELIARLIGDTARVKEGLKGFLVHVVTNGGLFIGVSVILIVLQPLLGSIFAVAFLLIGLITLFGTTCVYHRAGRFRSKEGRLAQSINKAWKGRRVDESFATINASSGEHEATVTRIQGRTTWAAHGIFGFAVLLVVWLGMRMVANRELTTEDMLLFIMYAMVTRAPIVQLTRQGTRTGKILACLDRIDFLLAAANEVETTSTLPALNDCIRLKDVRVRSTKSQGNRRRLSIDELELRRGSRVAVIGAGGAGKSTLLALLSGTLSADRGNIIWDDRLLSETALQARETRIAHVAQSVTFTKQRLFQYFGLPDANVSVEAKAVFDRVGATAVLSLLPDGVNTKLDSDSLSEGERKTLAVAKACLRERDLVLLDDPCAGLSRAATKSRIKRVARFHPNALIVATFAKLPTTDRFTRVIKLRHGKIIFDGTPQDFRSWLAAKRSAARTDRETSPEVS